jgi:hypothetical protein
MLLFLSKLEPFLPSRKDYRCIESIPLHRPMVDRKLHNWSPKKEYFVHNRVAAKKNHPENEKGKKKNNYWG